MNMTDVKTIFIKLKITSSYVKEFTVFFVNRIILPLEFLDS